MRIASKVFCHCSSPWGKKKLEICEQQDTISEYPDVTHDAESGVSMNM